MTYGPFQLHFNQYINKECYQPGRRSSRRVGLRDVTVLGHVLSNEGSLLTVAIYISLHTAKVTKELSVFQDLLSEGATCESPGQGVNDNS